MQEIELQELPGAPRADLKRRLLQEWLVNPFLDDDTHMLGLRLGESPFEVRRALDGLCRSRFLKPAGPRGHMLHLERPVRAHPETAEDDTGETQDKSDDTRALDAAVAELMADPSAPAETLPPTQDPELTAKLSTLFSQGNAMARSLVEAMPYGVVVIRSRGALEIANEKAAQWLGVPLGDLDGATFEMATGVNPLTIVDGDPMSFSLAGSGAVEVDLCPCTLPSGGAVLIVLRDVSLQEEASKMQAELQEELFRALRVEMVDPLLMIEAFLEHPNADGLARARMAMEQVNEFLQDFFLRGSYHGTRGLPFCDPDENQPPCQF